MCKKGAARRTAPVELRTLYYGLEVRPLCARLAVLCAGGLLEALVLPEADAEPEALALGDTLLAAPTAMLAAPFAVVSPVETAPLVVPTALFAAPVAAPVTPDRSALPLAEPLPLTELPSAFTDPPPLALTDGEDAIELAVPSTPCPTASPVVAVPLTTPSVCPVAPIAALVAGEMFGVIPTLPVALPAAAPVTVGGMAGMAPKFPAPAALPPTLPIPPMPPIAPMFPPRLPAMPPPSNPPAKAGVASATAPVTIADKAIFRKSIFILDTSSLRVWAPEEIGRLAPAVRTTREKQTSSLCRTRIFLQ